MATPLSKLGAAVRKGNIVDAFLEKEKVAGHKPNADAQEPSIIWQHYYAELPKEFVNTRNNDTVRGGHRDAVAVLKRTVEEVNLDDLHTVLDLIASNAIYRGGRVQGTSRKLGTSQTTLR